jgi:hypothetical protein
MKVPVPVPVMCCIWACLIPVAGSNADWMGTS